MAQPHIQPSFASGEWAPKLRSRVDIGKYRHGASLMRNFFVDWAGGGASTRQGTRFIAQTGISNKPVRIISFQPSATVSYVLEFGDFYIRFYSNGSQIISGGVPYQIASPFAASDLFPNAQTGNPGIKFVQDVTSMIICHPNYPAQILTIISPTNWTINPIVFGPSIPTPTGVAVISNLGAGTFSYGYIVTAVDINGQESLPSAPVTIGSLLNIQSNNGTNTVTWNAVSGAQSYNVYRTYPTVTVGIATGVQYGFVANVTGTTFTETTPGIAPDFSQTPPIGENPFLGSGLASINVTSAGSYTSVPGVTIGAPAAGGIQATAQASLGVISATVSSHSAGDDVVLTAGSPDPTGSLLFFGNGVVLKITSATQVAFNVLGLDGWNVNTVSVYNPGSITSGSTPSNPVGPQTGCNAVGYQGTGDDHNFKLNFTWGVTQVIILQPGAGYASAPSVTFSSGAATATATLVSSGGASGNPAVPAFLQQRLVLAAQPNNVQGFNMSQPGSFFNFNTTNPTQADDAISGSIISEQLNNIKSLVSVPTGLIALTGNSAWLINGGGGISALNPVTPSDVTAFPQAFNGASDVRPLKVNMDILYVTNKGNYVRDLTYNIYMNIFTGTDITTLSNHLFFGFNIVDWTWAEEPFKTLWAVRSDGTLLSLGFVKEQDLMGWAHHDTEGYFKSICSVIETTPDGNVVDAVYVVVQREQVAGGGGETIVQYVERLADRYFPFGHEDAWSVDCGLQTVPAVSSTGTLNIENIQSSTVLINDTTGGGLFTSTMASQGWILRAGGGIFKITSFTNVNNVIAAIIRSPTALSFEPAGVGGDDMLTQGFTIWQPVSSVSGLTQIANQGFVGVADGTVISGVVSNSGTVNLGGTFTKVTIGLPFTPQLQTLPLDLGEPTAQSKRKKIPAATLRVADALGLSIGTSFANVVPMKDFIIGNVGSQSDQVVTDLVNGDGRTIVDQFWQEPGVLCVQQTSPYPATILGIIPEVALGDTPPRRGM
jgi:hypothetical protein